MNTEFWTAGKIATASSFLLLLALYPRTIIVLTAALLLFAGLPWLVVSCVRDNMRRSKLRRETRATAPHFAAADTPPDLSRPGR
jgi:hypothetical protein